MNKINFNELTLENFNQWPISFKYFVFIALEILLGILGYWFILKPNFERYDRLFNQEIHLRAEFESKQQKANLDAHQRQLQALNKEYGTMFKLLVTENDRSSLLDNISKAGIASGLVFELFAPGIEEKKEFYLELVINIVVLGEYQQLAQFITRISEFSRLVTLDNFEIQRGLVEMKDNRSQIKIDDLLRMKIRAKIYRYNRE